MVPIILAQTTPVTDNPNTVIYTGLLMLVVVVGGIALNIVRSAGGRDANANESVKADIAQRNALTTMAINAQARADEYQDANTILTAKNAQLEIDKGRLENELKNSRDEIDKLSTRVDDLIKRVESLQESERKLSDINESRGQQVQLLLEDVKKLGSEVQQLKKQNAETMEEHENYLIQYRSLAEQWQKATADKTDLEDQVTDLKAQLEEKTRKLERYEQQADKVRYSVYPDDAPTWSLEPTRTGADIGDILDSNSSGDGGSNTDTSSDAA